MSNLSDSDSSEDSDFFEASTSHYTEEQKDQFRSVPVPQPKHNDLLKQALKKNRNLEIDLKSKYYDKLRKEQKLIQRIYRVQRRKDIFKGQKDYEIGLIDQNIMKNLRHVAQYLGKLKINLDSVSHPVLLTKCKILQRRNLSKLKSLLLDPTSSEITEEFLIFRPKCPNVESLSIRFRGIKNIPIEDFTLRLIRRIRKLKDLRLDILQSIFMKDEHLGLIGKALRSGLCHLESLEMNFGALSPNITAQGTVKLWKSLERIPNLKKLELTGGYRRGVEGRSAVDYEAFAVLCDVIQRKSTTLTTLKINLGSSELSYDAHQYLCKSLGNLLPRLHQLELRFSGRESISDDSLPVLGDLLSKTSDSLKSLSLSFYFCEKISSKGAHEFSEQMKKGFFPVVEKLQISFRYMPHLRFEGLFAIAEAISRAFPNVKDLKFRSSLRPSRYYDDKYQLNNLELQTKAEAILKEKLTKLPEKFRLDWDE